MKVLKGRKAFLTLICCALLFFLINQANVRASNFNEESLAAFADISLRPNMPFVGTDYAVYDPSVTHEGHPSICDTDSGYSGEVDGAWVSVKPNDHVIMGVWVKTEIFSEVKDLQAGAVMGFDFYAHTNLGFGIIGSASDLQAGHPTGEEQRCGYSKEFGYTINGANGLEQVSGLVCRVPFGEGWTLIKYDLIVPSDYYNYSWANYPQSGNNGVLCNPIQIDSIVPIFVVKDNAHAWFSDPFLYVNPSGTVSIPSSTLPAIFLPGVVESSNNSTFDLDSLFLLLIVVIFIGLAIAFVKIRLTNRNRSNFT